MVHGLRNNMFDQLGFDPYDRRMGLLRGSGSNAAPDQFQYSRTQRGTTIARDPYSGKQWDSRSEQWRDPGAQPKQKRKGSIKRKISNMQWLAENATPWGITSYAGGPSRLRTAAATRILNALGPDVNRINKGILNEALNAMGRMGSVLRYPMGRSAHVIATDSLMSRFFEEKYLLPAEAKFKGDIGVAAREKLEKIREEKKGRGFLNLGF